MGHRMTFVIKKPFINSPFVEEIFAHMDRLRIQKTRYGDVQSLAITGESGSGKSELAIRYALKYPIKNDKYRTHIPVAIIQLKSVSNPKALLVQILIAIRDPQNGEGSADVLLERLARLAKEIGLELIILDEIQTTIQRRSDRVLAVIADAVKDIILHAEIPIAFFGMPWSSHLFEANKQLSERVLTRIMIEPYKLSERNSRDDYKTLVSFLFQHYQISKKLEISNKELLVRLFAYTSGNMRRTVELIRNVYVESDLTESPFSIELFSRVLRSRGLSDSENPFVLPLEELTLYELAVHSDWNSKAKLGEYSIVQPQYTAYGVSSDLKLFKMAPV